MTQALAVQTAGTLMPTPEIWQTMTSMAKAFLESRLLPAEVDTPQKAVLLLQKARELNLPPTVALSEIAIIKGKPSCSAMLLRTLAYRDHGDDAFRVVESSATRCVVICKRRNWKEGQTFTFTIEDAQRANVTGSATWKSYPEAMLLARCTSKAVRACFPDSIAGLYFYDELGVEVKIDEDGEAQIASAAQQVSHVDFTAPTPFHGNLHPSTGVVVGTVQTSDDPPPPATNKRFYTDPQTGEMVPAPTPVAQRLYAALRQQAEAESMNTIDPANLLTAEDMNGATNNLVAELAARTTDDAGNPTAEELKDLTDLFRAYDGAGVKLLTPEKRTAGVVRWLIATLTSVRNDVKKRAKAPEAAVA